jgi:hypothetical protein
LDLPKDHPSNVTLKKVSFNHVCEGISDLLAEPIHLKHPYLLCDYKPMYGAIFTEEIKDYEYWGYSDIDLIYGNLQKFILPYLSEGYDSISFRDEIQSGSLSFFKNTETVNYLFKLEPYYLEAAKNDLHICKCLDEAAGDHSSWQGNSKLNLPKKSMTYIVANAHEKGRIKSVFKTLNCEYLQKGDNIHFDRGSVFINNREIAYYHFVCNKGNFHYKFPDWQIVPDEFWVMDTGFYNQNELQRFDKLDASRRLLGRYKKFTNRLSNGLAKMKLAILPSKNN